MRPPEEFDQQLAALGIELEPEERARLGAYLGLLLETNEQFNLTSITEPAEAWMRHILDSLTLLPYIEQFGAKRVIDVGSGGGLPGMPLAIVLPQVEMTLLEATQKKAGFLQRAGAELGLKNIIVVNDRAETAGRDLALHRERYDIVVSRAVGRMAVLIELTAPLARVGGLVLMIKGAKAGEEIAEAKRALYRLHCEVVDTSRTPTGTIVVIEKMRATPKIYPRRPGEPKRAPIQ